MGGRGIWRRKENMRENERGGEEGEGEKGEKGGWEGEGGGRRGVRVF